MSYVMLTVSMFHRCCKVFQEFFVIAMMYLPSLTSTLRGSSRLTTSFCTIWSTTLVCEKFYRWIRTGMEFPLMMCLTLEFIKATRWLRKVMFNRHCIILVFNSDWCLLFNFLRRWLSLRLETYFLILSTSLKISPIQFWSTMVHQVYGVLEETLLAWKLEIKGTEKVVLQRKWKRAGLKSYRKRGEGETESNHDCGRHLCSMKKNWVCWSWKLSSFCVLMNFHGKWFHGSRKNLREETDWRISLGKL